MSNYFIQTYTWNPWQNLAVEKYLSGQIQKGDVMLYLWQNDHTVVIGRNQNAIRECRAQLLEEEGGYLARRTTGGGAVYHDLGNLCFTFLASPEKYDLQKQLKVIQAACSKFGVETHFSGRNDIITEDGFKFSGNAFSQTSQCNIQHGTLMVDVDVSQLDRYLTPSKEKMKAKGVKSVQSRVCNLKALNPEVTTDAMRQALKESFEEIYGEFEELDIKTLDNQEVKETYDLYSSWEWKFGKSPECETSYRRRFDWGELEIYLKLNAMYISEIMVFSDMLDVELPGMIEKLLLGKRYDCADVDLDKELPECTLQQRQKLREVVDWLAGLRD
jgi:lipoate-protein ligase A